mmetsp:Transcript_22734/g.76347  ORF Transcript_22734/g.76347 Transcript_22734/m.76347 type:complete len:322 (-) Transcript_22734:436-1401(-)
MPHRARLPKSAVLRPSGDCAGPIGVTKRGCHHDRAETACPNATCVLATPFASADEQRGHQGAAAPKSHGPPGPANPCGLHPLHDARPSIEGHHRAVHERRHRRDVGPRVDEHGRRPPGRRRAAVVKIDEVRHLLAAPVDHPVVAVERGLEAQELAHAGPRGGLRGFSLEAREARVWALALVEPLPGEHLRPCALVHRVVDRNDGRHVLLARGPALAAHGVVEHLLARVDPCLALCVGDGGRLPLLGQGVGLALGGLLVRGLHLVGVVQRAVRGLLGAHAHWAGPSGRHRGCSRTLGPAHADVALQTAEPRSDRRFRCLRRP